MALTPLALMVCLAGHPPAPIPKPKPIELLGSVKEVSGGPGKSRALLVLEGGGSYQLHGTSSPSEAELKRLSGVEVRIYGVTGDARIPRGKHVLVDRYEIVDVGKGVVPRVGRIAEIELDGATRLIFVDETGHADLLPKGWSKKMARHVGAKVWMVGRRSNGRFTPRRFSILTNNVEKE